MFLYFTEEVAANHSSMDTDAVFLRRVLATIKLYIYNVFDRYFYLKRLVSKGALAAIHLRGTTIISGGPLQWSSIFKGTLFFFKQAHALIIPFFKDIELIRKSSYSYPFNELSFFYYKSVIAATHFFKLIVFLQNKNCIHKY